MPNNSARIIYNYDPTTNIEHWLRLYDTKAERLGLSEQVKIDQLPSYLPINIAQWLLSSSILTSWEATKHGLVDKYGIPLVHLTRNCLKKLGKLRQGDMPSKQFKTTFEATIMEVPEGTISEDDLRTIYLYIMNPGLSSLVKCHLNKDSTWSEVADKAIEIEEVLSDEYDLEDNLLSSLRNETVATAKAIPLSKLSLISAMKSLSVNDHDAKNQFNRWARPGVPICGHCGKEGHLSKRCFQVNNNKKSRNVDDDDMSILSGSTASGNDHVQVDDHAPEKPSTKEETKASKPKTILFYNGTQAKCELNGVKTHCLISTGIYQSGINEEFAKSLNLEIDHARKPIMKPSAGPQMQSNGVAHITLAFGNARAQLDCLVIPNLCHPIFFCQKDIVNNSINFDYGSRKLIFAGTGGNRGATWPFYTGDDNPDDY